MNREYKERGAYDTGIFGTYILTRMLFEHGFADTAYQLLTSEAKVSFSHMRKAGATTLWESWDGHGSHDHHMFGAVTDCLFEYILGIRETAPGYGGIEIRPQIPSKLDFVKGHITADAGKIEVSYRRGQLPEWESTVPDMEAVFYHEGKTIRLHAGVNVF